MNPNTDPSLPWTFLDGMPGSCPADGGGGSCGPGGVNACFPGSQANLPMPGPMTLYCFGSASTTSSNCPALPICLPQ